MVNLYLSLTDSDGVVYMSQRSDPHIMSLCTERYLPSFMAQWTCSGFLFPENAKIY